MYPEWVLKHKIKGTNISCINGRYYLYEVSSVWNKEKKRAQKITKKYLGRITEEGIINPKTREPKIKTPVSVKENGASSIICQLGEDIVKNLREEFPKEAEMLFSIAATRVIEHCPFKRVNQVYEHSFLSETFKNLNLSGKNISLFLREFGDKREQMVEFMKRFIGGNEHILFDGTSIISKSEKMNINRVGYNAHRQYDPQINLLYAFALESKQPVYYRLIAGNVRDVSAFKLSIEETKLHNMTVVANKGFGSKGNFDMLDDSGVKYIVPLRRNNILFNTAKLETGNKASFDGYFVYNKRPIWHYRIPEGFVYLDSDLKNEEEKDYIERIERGFEGYTKDKFIDKQFKFGTILIKTNLERSAEEIYSIYKERREIEQSFDFLKNLLEQDKSYMQNEKSLESWAFINHLSLMLQYKCYNLLKENNLLDKYSVADFIYHLKYIFKVKSDNQWLSTEVSLKTSKLLKQIGLHIT